MNTTHRIALAAVACATLAACGTKAPMRPEAEAKPVAAAPVTTPTPTPAPTSTVAAAAPASSGALLFAVLQPGGTTAQGGQHNAFAYSEKADDAKLDKVAVADGVARVTGSIWPQKGSGWAGIGFAASAGAPGKTLDASSHKTLRIQLASPTATQLRVRVMGTDQATREAGCYPVAMVAVSAELREHVMPLAGFQPEAYCGAKGKTVASTLPALAAIEVTDSTVAGGKRVVDYQVGRIELRP